MNKLGILIGIGILFVLLFGNAKAIADFEKSKDAVVTSKTTVESK